MKSRVIIVNGFLLGIVLLFTHASAWAKKAERVSINNRPVAQTITVDMQRRQVRGNGRVTVTIDRKQPGNGCTKVPFVRIVEGRNSLSHPPLAFEKIGSKKKGLCNFKKNVSVQPFTNDELLTQCRVPGNKTIQKNGVVSLWKTRPETTRYVIDGYKQECKTVTRCEQQNPDNSNIDNLAPRHCWNEQQCSQVPYGHQEPCNSVCGGRKIKNIAGKQQADRTIRFAANLRCQSVGQNVSLPPPCNLQGWWKLSSGVPSRDGEWKFYRKSSSKTQGNYSSKGPATKRNGGLIFGNGSGNATISSNKAFSWKLNNNLNCNGKANNSCSVIAGLCKGRVPGAKMYPFNLRKSNGPVDTGVKNPAGKPTTNTGSAIPQIKAPAGIWVSPPKPKP